MTGPKSSRPVLAALALAMVLVPTCVAAAKTESPSPKTHSPKTHRPKNRKPKCKAHYVARRVRVHKREHHRLVWVREWKCVKVKPTHATNQPTGTGPVTGVAPVTNPTGVGSGTNPTPSRSTDCAGVSGSGQPSYVDMDACGFPSPDSTGVPVGTVLTAYSGPSNISTAGTTIRGAEFTSPVTISASNVTIEDSDFDIGSASSQSGAVRVGSGVTGTLISYDTFHGTDGTSAGDMFAAVYNTNYTEGANAVTIDHVDFYDGQRIMHGPGTLQNSFCLDNVAVSGAHYECVYEGGGSMTINHNTLLTDFGQTAAIYLSTDFASLGTVQVTNNLLAGGGYALYGGAPNGGFTVGSETVTGNRFSRVYYAKSGQWGPNAYMPSTYTWSGNVWDDTGQSVSP
jgi:hypothetical protein